MLLVNTLLKNNQGHMERIVFMDDVICYTISLAKNEMPKKKMVSDIKQALELGALHICLEEKINPVVWDKLSDKQKDMADKACEIIKEVIRMTGNKIFDKNFRCNVIKEVAHKFDTTIKSVYKYLKRYWCGGMNKVALVPHFKNCGAKGEEREPQEYALGRRREDGIESFKVTGKVKKWFKSCLESNFYSHKRLSLIKCYYLLLNQYFKNVLNKVGEYPSFGQFRYYFDKTRDLKKEYCKRVGDKEYN